MSDVQFASYGNPGGVCGAWTAGTCDAKAALATVRRLCENRTACVVQANTATFGDPCPGVAKRLVVQARCAVPGGGTVPNHTYWRFADIDPVTTAFLRAATAPVRGHTTAGTSRNHSVIINFSTPPEWLYKTCVPPPRLLTACCVLRVLRGCAWDACLCLRRPGSLARSVAMRV